MYNRIHRAEVAGGTDLPCPRGATDGIPPTGLATASCTPNGDRIRVRVLGELDRDSASRLRPRLHEALDASKRGLDLDLGGLDFCDCSGLSVLMELRQRAGGQGKTVVIRVGSPVTDRLLGLLGAQDPFTPPDPPRLELRHPGPATAPSPKPEPSPGTMSSQGHAYGIGCRQTPRC
ncbi:STAS domain-containing protein [Streptomyces sp. NPDC001356]